MRTRWMYLLVLVLVLPCAAFGQKSKTGTAAAPFLEIPVGAPAVGMGGAFVGVASDATSLYWNPAGSARLQQNEIVALRTNWIAQTKFDFAALVVPIADVGSLGLSLTSLSMDDMKVRTVEKPEGTGEFFSAADIAVGVSYARQFSDRFSVGFTAKYIQQSIWHESADAIALDIGTLFRTDLFGGLTIGASLLNFGTSMKLSGRDTRYFISVDPTKMGTNDQIPTNLEFESWDLPLLFQLGFSATPIHSDPYRWTVAADALIPSDNHESVNVGTEFAYQDFLYLRAGYSSLFLSQAEGGLCLGVGLTSKMIFSVNTIVRFDYAYRDMGRLEAVHVFAAGVCF